MNKRCIVFPENRICCLVVLAGASVGTSFNPKNLAIWSDEEIPASTMYGPVTPLSVDERGVPCAMLAIVKNSTAVFPWAFHQHGSAQPREAKKDHMEGLVPDRFQPIGKFYTEVIPKLQTHQATSGNVVRPLIRGCGAPPITSEGLLRRAQSGFVSK
jgi:hypothetical protein